MVTHSQEKRMKGLHVDLKFSITKMLGWKELKDITPWDHNNYKSPTDTKKSASRIENVIPPKKIPKKITRFFK